MVRFTIIMYKYVYIYVWSLRGKDKIATNSLADFARSLIGLAIVDK